MTQKRFERLGETLLQSGIAPRHVRRYVSELDDHFEDLVREQTSQHVMRANAESAAHLRLGSDEELLAPMLARPELRSLASRYPWAVFGFGPVLMLIVAIAAAVLVIVALACVFPDPAPFRWAHIGRRFVSGMFWTVTYIAPLIIAAITIDMGMKQRMSPNWIVLGLAVICLVGGFHEMSVKWNRVGPNEFNLSFFVGPDQRKETMIECLYRVAVNLAFASLLYRFWRNRKPAA